jgi:hypothetical protein
LVVERDCGGEAAEALEDAFPQALEGAGAVAFEGEDVFAGPEDRFDALADRSEVRSVTRFVSAAGRMIVASRAATTVANARPA